MGNHNNDRQRDLPAQDPVLEVVLHPRVRYEKMEKQSFGVNLVPFRVRFLLVSRWWNINEDMRWDMNELWIHEDDLPINLDVLE